MCACACIVMCVFTSKCVNIHRHVTIHENSYCRGIHTIVYGSLSSIV